MAAPSFVEHARTLNLAAVRMQLSIFAVAALALVPVDLSVWSAEAPGIIHRWELGAVGWSLLGLALSALPALAARPLAIGVVGLLGQLAWIAHTAALLGDLGAPWFPILDLAMLAPAPFILRLLPRVLLTAAALAAMLVAFFATRPSAVDEPLFSVHLAMLGLVAIAGAATGEASTRGVVRTWALSRRLDESRRRLEELATSLDQKVKEQTGELRHLADRLQAAQEDERTRIARELHDELGQQLSAIRLALAHTRSRYASNPGAIGANLDDLDGLLAQATHAARGIVEELRPPILDEVGLFAAVASLAERFRERTGLELELRCEGDDRLPAEQVNAAWRIVQEALTNVVKHARATRVELHISAPPLRMRIQDDGVGFVRPGRGSGLVGMRERVEALGGRLRVDGARGTRVEVEL